MELAASGTGAEAQGAQGEADAADPADPAKPVNTQANLVQVETEKALHSDSERENENGEKPEGYDEVLRMVITREMDPKEVAAVKYIVRKENSHLQWTKQGLCFVLLTALILMNLCMGSSSRPSIIGMTKCSTSYWLIQVAFVVLCVFFTYGAVRIAQDEQRLKLKYNKVNVADSDLRYDNKRRLGALLVLGFTGGWVAGALGLGGGCVYNPALLALGIPPRVSSATGLYLVTFSKIASVLVYFLNGQLDIPYGLWIGFWSTVGMVCGLLLTQWYMKRSGRQSIIVWFLVVIFVISVVAIPIFGGMSLKVEHDEGVDLWAFSDICEVKK